MTRANVSGGSSTSKRKSSGEHGRKDIRNQLYTHESFARNDRIGTRRLKSHGRVYTSCTFQRSCKRSKTRTKIIVLTIPDEGAVFAFRMKRGGGMCR